MLNEQQSDLLKEYVNVFTGKAASMLSEMANQKILLRVPEVEVLHMAQDGVDALKKISLFSEGHIVSSVMNFGHDFSGRALLIFPAEKAKNLVDACLGDGNEEDASAVSLEDTDFDVLKEISNVLLNSIIGEFANMLGVKLEFTLPDVELIFVSEFEQKMYLKNNNIYILMLYTVFTLAETKVDGVVVIALGMDSLNMLIAKLNEVLGEANG
jgi:chemotaxis protein CheC